MKNVSKGMLVLAAFSLGLASCSDESPWSGSESEGGINLNFSSDARVMRQTRADDNVSPVIPDGADYSVGLVKSDGSYSKNWASVDAFNREKAFPIGDYTLTAAYGDLNQEGFELPCFKGSANVHVSPGETTDANIVATLANAMVSVRYTDAFKENFTAYSAAVKSEGHDFVIFSQTETRPAYVAPSNVTLDLTLTNLYGQTVTIQPANFEAVARHHYVVTVGVTGNTTSGDLALDVVFDDDVVAETVNVSLGDELYSAPAPTVTAKGFDPETAVESVESEDLATPAEFHVFSYGGLKSATLSIISTNNYTPTFGKSVQLVNANEVAQSQLEHEGVVCSGFFRNVDKMGVVDVTGFVANLPSGEYTVELQAVDALTRASDPLKLTAKVSPLSVSIAAAENVAMLSDEVKISLTTNCPSIKDKVSFQVPDANNRMVNAEIKDIEESAAPRSVAEHIYIYTLALDPQVRDAIDVIATIDNKRTESIKVPMTVPDYTIEADAFARKVVLKITSDSPETVEKVIDHLTFENAGKAIPSVNVSHDANGYITISGLEPSVEYVSLKAKLGSIEKAVPSFTTEETRDVPNGNFYAVTETINISSINIGGLYEVKVAIITDNYQNKSSIVRSTPDGWSNVNALTCNTQSSNMNTWYVVPSTFAENGATVMRSVGYSHNGAAISTSGGQMNTNYYCTNTPSDDQLDKAAGELFLGSCSLNNRVDGVEWSTRPSSLTFDYTYAPLNNENGEAYIKVISVSGKVLSENTVLIPAASSMTTMTVPVGNYPFGEKAGKIQLGFKSTKSGVTPSVHIPTGSELSEGVTNIRSESNRTIAANRYKAVAVGSVLTIDNVKLGYEANSTTNSAVRTHRKASARK